MATNKKKILILCSMVVLLAVSGYLNYVLNTRGPGEEEGGAPIFFESYRSKRTATRNEALAQCDIILASESSTAADKATADSTRLEIIDAMLVEENIEQLIISKGFDDAVVSATKNSITVIVLDDDLTAAKVAQILNTILTNTEYTILQVVVYPYSI